MKKYTFEEKRIYLAEIKYNCNTHTAGNVFKAFIEKYSEYKECKYEWEIIEVNKGICRIYSESCYDFIEQ